MNNSKKSAPRDTETILMALDQISQTIDVMTSVVGRMRSYLQEQESSAQLEQKSAPRPREANRTLH